MQWVGDWGFPDQDTYSHFRNVRSTLPSQNQGEENPISTIFLKLKLWLPMQCWKNIWSFDLYWICAQREIFSIFFFFHFLHELYGYRSAGTLSSCAPTSITGISVAYGNLCEGSGGGQRSLSSWFQCRFGHLDIFWNLSVGSKHRLKISSKLLATFTIFAAWPMAPWYTAVVGHASLPRLLRP